MCKYVYSVCLMVLLTTGIVLSADFQGSTEQTAQKEESAEKTKKLQVAKAKVEKELKKNQGQLKKIRSNKLLAPALEKVEGNINKIVTSSEFKAIIEKIASKQAQDIEQGKTFEEVKYSHSLATAFPKMTNANSFLARVYKLMANVEQDQLLLSKLNNPQEAQAAESTEKPAEEVKVTVT